MKEDNDEIQDIITQLKHLQLQQTELLECLDRARCKEPNGPPNEERAFAIGDRVCIRNPRPFQASHGIITKITAKRVIICTRSGNTVQRAEKNISFDHE